MEFLARVLQQTLDVTQALDVLKRESDATAAERPVLAAQGKNAYRCGRHTKGLGSSGAIARPFFRPRQEWPPGGKNQPAAQPLLKARLTRFRSNSSAFLHTYIVARRYH